MSSTPDEPAPDSSPEPTAEPVASPDDPGASKVYQYLLYGVSLPERAIRGTSAVVGGAISEPATLLVPQAFRNSKSYDVFVQQMLDFMVRDLGGVQQPGQTEADPEVESHVARKTVGTLIDMVGATTLHLSPLTVLAIVSDVAYGSQTYLTRIIHEGLRIEKRCVREPLM